MLLVFPATVHAASSFNPKLLPLEESQAFRQYLARPVTDLSKLIFLIDRFKEADIQIRYGGIYFAPSFAARVARWFLAKYYQGETPREWIMKWCDTAIGSGELIWVRDAEGNFKLSREVLFEELEKLEKAFVRQRNQDQSS